MRQDELNLYYQQQLAGDPLTQGKAIVPGEGRYDRPRMMLVGEAPGEQESLQRRPFVGKAGKMLDAFLQSIQIMRQEIYITNTVKIRPTLEGPGGRLSNRPPNADELALFFPWLMAETAVVNPQLIVTLGNTPLKAFLGDQAGIGSYHGRNVMTLLGFPLFALYHPAAVIYNPALKAVYEQDLMKLKEYLATGAAVSAD